MRLSRRGSLTTEKTSENTDGLNSHYYRIAEPHLLNLCRAVTVLSDLLAVE